MWPNALLSTHPLMVPNSLPTPKPLQRALELVPRIMWLRKSVFAYPNFHPCNFLFCHQL